MEETKYYTPTIEEFHVGFELELKLHELKDWEKHTWLPGDQASSVAKYLDQIRVKCLDREDIESFGFKYMWADYGEMTYTLDTFLLQVRRNTIEIYNNRIKDVFKSVLFRGIIKNKSELKRVLHQLEIIL